MWELATREVPYASLSPMECGMKVSEYVCVFDSMVMKKHQIQKKTPTIQGKTKTQRFYF